MDADQRARRLELGGIGALIGAYVAVQLVAVVRLSDGAHLWSAAWLLTPLGPALGIWAARSHLRTRRALARGSLRREASVALITIAAILVLTGAANLSIANDLQDGSLTWLAVPVAWLATLVLAPALAWIAVADAAALRRSRWAETA